MKNKLYSLFEFTKRKAKYLVIALILGSSVFLMSAVDNSFEIVKNLDILYTVVRELDAFYVDEIDHGKTIKVGIDKMLESLDPYTNYIPESKIEDFRFMTTGSYGGIGALIRKTGENAVVTDPYEGKPAQKAGIKAGDILLRIDEFDTNGKEISAISEKLKGIQNSTLKVVVERFGEPAPLTFNVVRENIHISSVPFYDLLEGNIAYIQFNNFTQNCAQELKSSIDSLVGRGATSMILDLRGNPGGLLNEAITISNFFLPKGQLIVSTKGKMKQWNRDYTTTDEPILPKMPVVVLVNRGSASASEIVAGALQDLDRGVVLGSRTFGKGLVQATRPLSYKAQMKLTTAKYYIPSGRCIQALDYSHRNEDGSVGTVPDSLISEFTTKNGRKVYDGGGIKPDIDIETNLLSRITAGLYVDNYIFDFATQYAHKTNLIESPQQFSISDNDYTDFIEFVNKGNFKYEMESNNKLSQLIKTLKSEKYYEIVEDEVKELEQKMKQDLQKDLMVFKDEISRLINEEVISRYYYQRGRAIFYMRHDAELDSAKVILNNMDRYNSILQLN
ncbi:MAG: S41 family peptidase [Salinivirgaceae bacterium]|nr:S41 family peptidase [Salinivirgaceae bacterium]MDD4746109.1 S41 family peptidase [Salinivirgaceae bacterium]MDY0279859.1 S41 family peptidase [Salinivirgaceae bacterium]